MSIGQGLTGPASAIRLPVRDIASLVAVGVVQAVGTGASVLLIRHLIDGLNNTASPLQALPIAYMFLGAALVIGVTRGVEYVVSERVGYRLVARLRMVLYKHLLNLPARGVLRSSQGGVLLRFTGDLTTFRTWVSRGLGRGIVSSLTLAGGLVVVFVIDWVSGLIVVGFYLVAAAWSISWGYRVRRSTMVVRRRRSRLATNIAEQVRSLAVVQSFGRSAGETNRLQAQNDALLGAQSRAAVARGALRVFSSTGASLAVGAVMLAGIYQLQRRQITIGGLVAEMTAVRFLKSPIQIIGRSHEYWQAAQISKQKLQDFLAQATRPDAGKHLPRLRPRGGRVELRAVTVPGALDAVDLVVEPGELVAVIGDNGAGKSTLLSVIARVVEPSEGQVLIDGQVLSECSIRSIARNVGLVSPDLPLMRGTIRRNLSYRYGHATDRQLQHAIVMCRVDEILDSVEGGVSARLVEGGANLSVGHRQRIALARAVIGNPRVLLLDEPTTNLDPASRDVFLQCVRQYRGTVFLVTNDPVEASLADHVCVIDSGQITSYITGDRYRAETAKQHQID